MEMKKRIGLLIASFMLVILLTQIGQADFGGFSGDTDYGGSFSSDSFSSNDYDYSSSGWSSGDSYGSSGGSGNLSGGETFVIVLVVIIFIVMSYVKKHREESTHTPPSAQRKPRPSGAEPTPADQLRPISELINIDPHFSESALRERVAELYVRFQNAWTQKDLAPVRPYLSPRFFAQTSKQLQNDYIDKGRTSYLDNIAVLDVQIRGYRSLEEDELTVFLRTRFINYTRDDESGDVIRGSTSQEIFMEYEWSMVRKKGVLTRPDGNAPGENCKNCGAVIDLALSSKCTYCGTVLDTAENDWVVAGIKGLSQRGRQ